MAAFFNRPLRLLRSIKIQSATFVSNFTNKNLTMEDADCFIGSKDQHNGVIVDSTKEPCSADRFVIRLQASLTEWTKANRKTVWFRVDRSSANWIPHLVNDGFYFHHAKDEFVVLYRCLTSDKNIPPYAHTNIGVGAFIINDATNEVLVIKEKYASDKATRKARWKLPGGYVEPGESLPQAVEREVKEETGITAKFKSVVGFRHVHGYAFGCSDIYFVARLIPETYEIRNCPKEISECVWMKLDEYANHPDVHNMNRFIAKKMIEYLEKHVEIGLVHGHRPNSTDPAWIYVITSDNEENPVVTN